MSRARRLERSSWILGFALIGVWSGMRVYGTWASSRAVQEFDASASSVDMSQWSPSRRQHYEESLAKPSGPAIAVLEIARVGLTVPLFEGTSEQALDRGVGHIEGTDEPGDEGNVVIAGHRDGFFRGLKDVTAGDLIELRTHEGNSTYVVQETRIVPPEDVSVLDPTPVPSLTLVTCYPFYFVGPAPQRFVVRAVRR
jgi:sortase A